MCGSAETSELARGTERGRSLGRPTDPGGRRPRGGPSPGRPQARVHLPFVIVSPRERGWSARSSTREPEFPDLSSRVLGWFGKLCPELGLYRVSTIFRALVSWDRPPPIHVCSERGRRLPATCGFVPAACGRRALVSRGARGAGMRPGPSPTRTRPRLPCAVRTGGRGAAGPCALGGPFREGCAH